MDILTCAYYIFAPIMGLCIAIVPLVIMAGCLIGTLAISRFLKSHIAIDSKTLYPLNIIVWLFLGAFVAAYQFFPAMMLFGCVSIPFIYLYLRCAIQNSLFAQLAIFALAIPCAGMYALFSNHANKITAVRPGFVRVDGPGGWVNEFPKKDPSYKHSSA